MVRAGRRARFRWWWLVLAAAVVVLVPVAIVALPILLHADQGRSGQAGFDERWPTSGPAHPSIPPPSARATDWW
jgi:hypothetical protein